MAAPPLGPKTPTHITLRTQALGCRVGVGTRRTCAESSKNAEELKSSGMTHGDVWGIMEDDAKVHVVCGCTYEQFYPF